MLYALPLDIGGAISALPDNPFKITDLGGFISSVIGLGIILAAVACLLYLIWGGFDWITSGGDKTGIENARNKITHALIGLTIVVAVWAIFGLVQTFLGVNITSGGGGGGSNNGGSANVRSGGFKCPGPNCDRCQNWPTRRSDWVPSNDPQWQINSGCP